ncbi:MAG: hypothetical protein GY909_13670 [Oligoflexia bacterium]|nr:hypothetical protein [Oligoflexia bacterium]
MLKSLLSKIGIIKLKKFPWYDSEWLSHFVRLKNHYIAHSKNDLDLLLERTNILRTDKSFKPVVLKNVLSDDVFTKIKKIIEEIEEDKLKDYEKEEFGRKILHNHPYFNEIHNDLINLVSEKVGEEVEASYNFLSLYKEDAKCPLHLDAPSAKWTLDICIDQSVDWPIYFSEIIDWPDRFENFGSHWESEVLKNNKFNQYILKPNEGVIFSGSSQWHYRDSIRKLGDNEHSHLLFFHFAPKGHAQVSDTVIL